jgi:hypothetical protein
MESIYALMGKFVAAARDEEWGELRSLMDRIDKLVTPPSPEGGESAPDGRFIADLVSAASPFAKAFETGAFYLISSLGRDDSSDLVLLGIPPRILGDLYRALVPFTTGGCEVDVPAIIVRAALRESEKGEG